MKMLIQLTSKWSLKSNPRHLCLVTGLLDLIAPRMLRSSYTNPMTPSLKVNETFAQEKFPYLTMPKDFVAHYQPGKKSPHLSLFFPMNSDPSRASGQFFNLAPAGPDPTQKKLGHFQRHRKILEFLIHRMPGSPNILFISSFLRTRQLILKHASLL